MAARMTGVTLALVCAGVIGLMTFAGWLAEMAGPNPLASDERRAYPMVERRRHDRQVLGVLVGIAVVVFVAALTIPQGTPA